jgi:hypothetical protein
MVCSGCSKENPGGSRFCLQCGAALGSLCASCGAELPIGARFCNQCGSTVAGAEKVTEEERPLRDAPARGASARAEVEQLLEGSVAYIAETGTRAWIPFLHEARAELERACGDAAAAERELREAQRLHATLGATGHAERIARELGG